MKQFGANNTMVMRMRMRNGMCWFCAEYFPMRSPSVFVKMQ